jgi:hypothetical protein
MVVAPIIILSIILQFRTIVDVGFRSSTQPTRLSYQESSSTQRNSVSITALSEITSLVYFVSIR